MNIKKEQNENKEQSADKEETCPDCRYLSNTRFVAAACSFLKSTRGRSQ
jgi:hypothetical protein